MTWNPCLIVVRMSRPHFAHKKHADYSLKKTRLRFVIPTERSRSPERSRRGSGASRSGGMRLRTESPLQLPAGFLDFAPKKHTLVFAAGWQPLNERSECSGWALRYHPLPSLRSLSGCPPGLKQAHLFLYDVSHVAAQRLDMTAVSDKRARQVVPCYVAD